MIYRELTHSPSVRGMISGSLGAVGVVLDAAVPEFDIYWAFSETWGNAAVDAADNAYFEIVYVAVKEALRD
jgi:hypothetical protein